MKSQALNFLALLTVAAIMFSLGRCAGGGSCPEPETVTRIDTVIHEKIITIEPIPEPTVKTQAKIYRPSSTHEADSLVDVIHAERARYLEIVRQKENTIRLLKEGIVGVGDAVGEDEGVGFEITEEQKVNTYEIDTTTAEGIRAQMLIPVLGELYSPPFIALSIPSLERNTTETYDRTKTRAIGLSAEMVGKFTEFSPDYRIGAYYRRNRLTFAGNWQVREKIPAIGLKTDLFRW